MSFDFIRLSGAVEQSPVSLAEAVLHVCSRIYTPGPELIVIHPSPELPCPLRPLTFTIVCQPQ